MGHGTRPDGAWFHIFHLLLRRGKSWIRYPYRLSQPVSSLFVFGFIICPARSRNKMCKILCILILKLALGARSLAKSKQNKKFVVELGNGGFVASPLITRRRLMQFMNSVVSSGDGAWSRIFHWAMAASFILTFFSKRWRFVPLVPPDLITIPRVPLVCEWPFRCHLNRQSDSADLLVPMLWLLQLATRHRLHGPRTMFMEVLSERTVQMGRYFTSPKTCFKKGFLILGVEDPAMLC